MHDEIFSKEKKRKGGVGLVGTEKNECITAKPSLLE